MFSPLNYALSKRDWDKANSDLDVLGIGARNLLTHSNDKWEQGSRIFNNGNPSNSTQRIRLSTLYPIVPNTSYVISGGNTFTKYVFLYLFDGNGVYTRSVNIGYYDTDIYKVFVTAENEVSYSMVVGADDNVTPDDIGATLLAKLEQGALKATEWTPAPEDIDTHPFVAKMAEVSYQSRANAEDIRKLNNALTSLGGGS